MPNLFTLEPAPEVHRTALRDREIYVRCSPELTPDEQEAVKSGRYAPMVCSACSREDVPLALVQIEAGSDALQCCDCAGDEFKRHYAAPFALIVPSSAPAVQPRAVARYFESADWFALQHPFRVTREVEADENLDGPQHMRNFPVAKGWARHAMRMHGASGLGLLALRAIVHREWPPYPGSPLLLVPVDGVAVLGEHGKAGVLAWDAYVAVAAHLPLYGSTEEGGLLLMQAHKDIRRRRARNPDTLPALEAVENALAALGDAARDWKSCMERAK